MITLEKAKEALVASEAKAKELNVKVATVVVDAYGVPIAMSKMEGAFNISPKFAQMKAYTSAMIGVPSEGLAEYACEGKPYFGLTTAFSNELITIAGGLPVMKDDKIIGAVGVGGSFNVLDDAACASEAVKKLLS